MKKKVGKPEGQNLFSKISVDASLISSFAKVKERLKQYPSMKLARDGTSLLYEIKSNADRDRFFELELGNASIAITIYSGLTPARYLQETMLRLLGAMQTLSDCYRITLESLYPYLIMTIAAQQLDAVLHDEAHDEGALPDVVLSRRLIALVRENADLKEEREAALKNFRKVVLKAVVLSSVSDHSVDSISARLGIERKDVVAALDSAEGVGYRVVSTGKGSFNLVRI